MAMMIATHATASGRIRERLAVVAARYSAGITLITERAATIKGYSTRTAFLIGEPPARLEKLLPRFTEPPSVSDLATASV